MATDGSLGMVKAAESNKRIGLGAENVRTILFVTIPNSTRGFNLRKEKANFFKVFRIVEMLLNRLFHSFVQQLPELLSSFFVLLLTP